MRWPSWRNTSFHHLPVVETGEVVGMVSDRDLLMMGEAKDEGEDSSPSKPARSRTKRSVVPRVADIMSQPVFTLSPEDAVRSATWLMMTHRIHAIPLVRGDRLVGMVTTSDLLRGVITSHAFPELANSPLLQQPVISHAGGKVATVGPKTSLDEVVEIMRKKQIRHLPVVVDTQLLGVVSDRDIRRALGRAAALDAEAQESGKFYIGPSEVCEIMTESVRTISPSATTEAATDELLRHHVHCLPLVDDRKLIGMITDTDLLRAIGAADKGGATIG